MLTGVLISLPFILFPRIVAGLVSTIDQLASEGSHNIMPFPILLIGLLWMMIVVGIRSRMKRQITVAFTLVGVGLAAITIMDLFSEYALDAMHVLNHSMFCAILVLSAKSLLTERIPRILDLLTVLELDVFNRFQYALARSVMAYSNRIRDVLELNGFDAFQYALAQTVISLAGSIRKMQTGKLNFNMIGVMIGFILFLLLALLLGFIRL